MGVTKVYNIEQAEKEVFKPLGLSRTSLYRLITTKQLKAVKAGRRYLITEKAINEFLEGAYDENCSF